MLQPAWGGGEEDSPSAAAERGFTGALRRRPVSPGVSGKRSLVLENPEGKTLSVGCSWGDTWEAVPLAMVCTPESVGFKDGRGLKDGDTPGRKVDSV